MSNLHKKILSFVSDFESNIDFIYNIKTNELYEALKVIKNKADIAYYNNDDPILLDWEYDKIKTHLLSNNIQLETFLGDAKVDYFEVIDHKMPMLSLDNAFTLEDLTNYRKKIHRFLTSINELEFIVEPKLDGLSLSLVYENGNLKQALTRGNGLRGENVINNVYNINSIPKKIEYLSYIEVRGEVYMDKLDFIAMNKQQTKNNNKIFANPRNAAAGSLRTLDANKVKDRPLKFIPWGIGVNTLKYNNLWDVFAFLKQLGFNVSKYNKTFSTIDEIYNYYEYITSIRDELPYDIDGMVYKINDLAIQNKMGVINKKPRWAIAHKFPAKEAITTVNDIVIQVGRTGVLTPIAQLNPINIGGALVSRASLHNFSEIQKKHVRVKSKVVIKRAGDVIPYIVKVVSQLEESLEYIPPKKCPICGADTVFVEEEIALRCSGGAFYCKAQQFSALVYLVSEKGFNIKGLGKGILKFLYDNEYIKYPADIWKLKYHKEELINIKGFGDKSIEKMLWSIEQSKEISLNNFISSLGIISIGEDRSKILAQYFKNFNSMYEYFIKTHDATNSLHLHGFGDNLLNNIYKYFQQEKTHSIIDDLLNQVIVHSFDAKINDGKLNNQTFLFTGTLTKFSRGEAKQLVESEGGIMLNTVSKKLDYLVVGEKAGIKQKKAEEIKTVKIITEDRFLSLIK